MANSLGCRPVVWCPNLGTQDEESCHENADWEWEESVNVSEELGVPAAKIEMMKAKWVYVTGGSRGGLPSCVERYDLCEDVWSESDVAPMLKERYAHGLVEFDGDLYAVGGESESSVERYDSLTNSWSFVQKMTTSRDGVGCGW